MDVSKVNLVIDMFDHVLHDASKPWNRPFGWIEAQFGIGRFKVVLALVAIIAFHLIFGNLAMVSSNAIGFVYPVYATIPLLIQTPQSPLSAAVINKWLTYWMTFAAILIVEQHFAFILRLIPFYLLMKSAFLIWCFMPINNNGVFFINLYVIRPYLGDYYDSSLMSE